VGGEKQRWWFLLCWWEREWIPGVFGDCWEAPRECNRGGGYRLPNLGGAGGGVSLQIIRGGSHT